MKKFFKKTMSLVLVGAMAMTLLVGCGGGNSDSETKKGGAAVKDAAGTSMYATSIGSNNLPRSSCLYNTSALLTANSYPSRRIFSINTDK